MIAAKVTGLFLYEKKILAAVEKARVKVLNRSGYKVQQAAKASLIFKAPVRKPRYSKNLAKRKLQFTEYIKAKKANASPPGKPPYVRRKTYPNLSSVVYAIDSATNRMLIGPVVRRSRSSSAPSPKTNEFGGRVTISVKTKRGTKPMVANYKPRPVMGPALRKTLPEVPQLMSNSVVGP